MRHLMILLLFAVAGFADDVTIHSVTRAAKDPTRLLTVKFDEAPTLDFAIEKNHWTAWCFSSVSTPPTLLTVVNADHRGGDFADRATINLTFDHDIDHCVTVEVTLLTKKLPSARWPRTPKEEETPAPLKPETPTASTPSPKPGEAPSPAASKPFLSHLFAPTTAGKDPDYSFSGTVVAGVGARPLYTVDGSFQTKFISRNRLSLATIETVKTASSNTIDPDSFNSALTLLYFPETTGRSTLKFRSNLAGLEFNKQSSVLNEVSSSSLSWMRLLREGTSAQGDLATALSLTLAAGVEIGDNFKNEFTVAGKTGASGSGLIFRGVPGASLAFVFIPDKNPKHAIRWSSNYLVRLPVRDELFLILPEGASTAVPHLGTRPRHYLENDLSFQINDYFGLKIQHTYGSLPPAFQFVNHTVSAGIVFKASQPR